MKRYRKVILALHHSIDKDEAKQKLGDVIYDPEEHEFRHRSKDSEGYIQLMDIMANKSEYSDYYKDTEYILCTANLDVLSKLKARKIPFVIIMPADSEDREQRLHDRGIITMLKDSDWWQKYLMDMRSFNMPILHLARGQSLSEVLNRFSTHDYLLSKIDDVKRYVLFIDD